NPERKELRNRNFERETRKRDYASRGCSQSGRKESRRSRAGGRGIWREGESAFAARSFPLVPERAPPGHAQGQGKERGFRRRPQALEAERHRQSSSRLDP